MTRVRAFPGRVIFDHIPKTAGMAVNAWLIEALGTRCVSPTLDGVHGDLIRRYGGEYSVICAHMDFVEGDALDPRYQYVTCFRDPVDRAISWLFYALNDTPDTPDTANLVREARVFLDSEGREASDTFLPHISNYLVRHFSQVDHVSPLSDAERIDVALKAVKQYDVVGLQHRMAEFVGEFADLICVPRIADLPKTNVTSSRPAVTQVSAALRERIAELNQLDLRLYEQVLAWKEGGEAARPASRGASGPWQRCERPSPVRTFTSQRLVVGEVKLRGSELVVHGQAMEFDVNFLAALDLPALEAGLFIVDALGSLAFGTNGTLQGSPNLDLKRGTYRITHRVVADLAPGKYRAGFGFAEILPDGTPRMLARTDAVCEFEVRPPQQRNYEGYALLSATQSCVPTAPAGGDSVVADPHGLIRIEGEPPRRVRPGEEFFIDARIVNRGELAWRGDAFRPVHAAYHWLMPAGETVVFDGLRTALPGGAAEVGETACSMKIVAPAGPGRYALQLTLVQEMVGWFEDLGGEFETARLEIEVL